jgi:hypothetical protein
VEYYLNWSRGVQASNVTVQRRLMTFSDRTPIVEPSLRRQAMNKTVCDSESATAFKLRQHQQNLPDKKHTD